MPVAAAESPVKAFRSEITTGMSAPPIGNTTALPSSAAESSSTRKSASECSPPAIATPQPTAISSSSRFTYCWEEPSVIGLPGMISWSFPNAMFEPQKETEPTIAANSEKIAM